MPDAQAAERVVVRVDGGEIEVWSGRGARAAATPIVAAHPADPFGAPVVALLQEAAQNPVLCINPFGLGGSSAATPSDRGLEDMVDRVEAARRALELAPIVFWGMSGGGWLAQLYAQRYPEAVCALILESSCACFRLRLADPECALSPFHRAWRERLAREGLLDRTSHDASARDLTTEWLELEGVGSIFRRVGGPALLVSPTPQSEAMRRVMPALFAVDTRGALARVRVPTLVLCGSADPVLPVVHTRALHEAIADSQWTVIEGAGHVPVSARHPAVAAVVQEFLDVRVRRRAARV